MPHRARLRPGTAPIAVPIVDAEPTYGQALGLTHCGRCGKAERLLYWCEEYPIEDPHHWYCDECWEAWDAA